MTENIKSRRTKALKTARISVALQSNGYPPKITIDITKKEIVTTIYTNT